MSKRTVMRSLDPLERSRSFAEVSCGYNEAEALLEADRCLNCKNKPCMSGCPVNIDIPAFIAQIKAHNYEGAYQIISQANALPAICGRVCPQESQCEHNCVCGIKGEPVAIGRLERFVADRHQADVKPPLTESTGIKTAIIGSGPSGLTCAKELAKTGHDVTVFEALHVPGGVLTYGIPEFRLPKAIVAKEIQALADYGVKICTNMVIGRTLTIDELFHDGYKAVYIGTGAGLPRMLNVPGENLNGVYTANEFLTRVNLMKAYREGSATPVYHGKQVVVVGGGNVAVDAARCALRIGLGTVTIVYRRTRQELPARQEEIAHAEAEGITFRFLTNPIAILGDDDYHVKAIKCSAMELGAPDASGRRRPLPVADSDFVIPADMVIVAVGTSPNPLLKMTTDGLSAAPWGGIIVDEQGQTSKLGVYAGGDAVTGAATVIKAMQAGKQAAAAINEYLSKVK